MKASNKNFNRHPSTNNHTKADDTKKNLDLFHEAGNQELALVLATIVGELDFALNNTSPLAKENSIKVAVHAAECAISLARNLRYFSSSNKLNYTTIDLSQVLLDTVELVEKELELNQIKITVMAEAGSYVVADPKNIQQLILSLLAHARKSLPTGGQITLSLRQQEHYIEIRCHNSANKDTEKHEPHSHRETDSSYQDPLLSLQQLEITRAKMLVESHGGTLTVQPGHNMGTTVFAQFPFNPRLPKPEPFIEERRFRRVPLQLPVELCLNRGQQILKTELKTLSIGGCFAIISDPVVDILPEINDLVTVRVHHFGSEVFEVPKGRIANLNWAGTKSGVGIEFLELDNRAKKLLSAIVKSHSA